MYRHAFYILLKSLQTDYDDKRVQDKIESYNIFFNNLKELFWKI